MYINRGIWPPGDSGKSSAVAVFLKTNAMRILVTASGCTHVLVLFPRSWKICWSSIPHFFILVAENILCTILKKISVGLTMIVICFSINANNHWNLISVAWQIYIDKRWNVIGSSSTLCIINAMCSYACSLTAPPHKYTPLHTSCLSSIFLLAFPIYSCNSTLLY